MPNCYLSGVGVSIPANVTIKNFEMVMIFPNSIYESSLEELNDTRGRVEVDSPCEIKERSSDPDKRLTITVSSNKHELLIRGHDFTRFDAQQILLAFYPAALRTDLFSELDYRGDATYSAYGRDLQAKVHVKPE